MFKHAQTKFKIDLSFIFLFVFFFSFLKLTPAFSSTASWYNTDYKYRKPITIDNTNNNSALTNYQIKITLSSANFDFTKAQTNGADIRFTDNDGITLLNYWLETYNSSDQTATFYVKIPSISTLSTRTIYLYYGNSFVNSASSGTDTFNLYDGMDSTFSIKTALSNASSSQTIPTYDGSNQSTHPDVVYFANGWNGYKYWVVVTPLPNNNSVYENPSILASNDGSSWEVPPGLTNPVIATGDDFRNSDPDLLYNTETNELWMYYRVFNTDLTNEYIYRTTSTDGITWTTPALLISFIGNGSYANVLSPSIVKNGSNYYMWTVDAGAAGCSSTSSTVKYQTSTDGITWSASQPLGISQSGYVIWHVNVNYISSKKEYWMVFNAYATGAGCSHDNLFFAKSTDGINWTTYAIPIMLKSGATAVGWDDRSLYRSAFVYDSINNIIKTWYGGIGTPFVYNIGYAQTNYTQFLYDLNNNSTYNIDTFGGSWSNSSDQIKRGSYAGKLVQSNGAVSMIINKSSPLTNNFYYEWDMYDDLSDSAFRLLRIRNNTVRTGIGVWTGCSTTKYCYHNKSYSYTATSITRTLGWHKFGILLKSDQSASFYVDDQSVGSLTNQFNDATNLDIEGLNSSRTTFYIDDIRVRNYSNPEPTSSVGTEINQLFSGLSLNSPTGTTNGKTRMTGNAATADNSQYMVSDVQYTVNGGGWSQATATDGNFNNRSEKFYFDFLPTENNNPDDGYTVRVKAQSTSGVWQDHLFYFQPFNLENPANNYLTVNTLPMFSFSVNKARFADLKENLAKFQILVNKDNKGWKTYLDDIPVDYEKIKNSGDNLQKTTLSTNGNGIYEDKKLWISYENNNAKISVYAKDDNKFFEDGGHRLSSASYQWKVLAINKAGKSQETGSQQLRVNQKQAVLSQVWFPLTVESITGIGNLDLSTLHPQDIQDEYFTSSFIPTFKGIALSGTTVTLVKEDPNCQSQTGCTDIYTATTNPDSHYNISLPDNSLRYGQPYTIALSVKDSAGNYNELPAFKLRVGSLTKTSTSIPVSTTKSIPTPPSSVVLPSVSTPNKTTKHCLFLWCW